MQISSKIEIIVKLIAMNIYSLNCGDKIKSVREFTKEFDYSHGTVQNALNFLEEENVIELKKRGNKGSFIVKKDEEKLLDVIGKKYILGCMPIPYTKRYEGLATGLNQLKTENRNFFITYLRGGRNRLAQLLEGNFDFAIVSKAAALESIQEGKEIKIIKAFGESSFVSKHILVRAPGYKEKLSANTLVGVDFDSVDQLALTNELIKKYNVRTKQVGANSVKNALMDCEINATVWIHDEIKENSLNLNYDDLDCIEGVKDYTEAVLVVRTNNMFIENVISRAINESQVIETQKDVIEGNIRPIY